MRVPHTANFESFIASVTKILNGRVDIYDNVNCRIIDVADTGPVDTEFSVTHGLGRIPSMYVWNIDRAGTVYDSNKATWTSTAITLKCSSANAVLRLLVL